MSKAHAILSPSAAGRWTTCTPSARFEEQIPEEDTVFSIEGTIAHAIAALILSSRAGMFTGSQRHFNKELDKLEGDAGRFYASLDQKNQYSVMLDHAEDYADFVLSYLPISGYSKLYIERRVYMDTWAPMCDGTADAGLITPDILYVNDYKYGAGKRVSAVRNKQMMLYALGLLEEAWHLGHAPVKVVMSIIQPRVSEQPSTWSISVDELLDWAEGELKDRAKEAIGGQGDFVTGDHCQFCKARKSCLAWHKEFEHLIDIKDKKVMSAEDREKVLRYGDAVASWAKSVKETVRADMQAGKKVPGFKLVAGRSTRAFVSEAVAIDELISLGYDADDIYKSSFRGITELEGLLGKKKFAAVMGDNLRQNEGLPQIVDVSDDRQAIDKTGFDEYTEHDNRRNKKRSRSARR